MCINLCINKIKAHYFYQWSQWQQQRHLYERCATLNHIQESSIQTIAFSRAMDATGQSSLGTPTS